MSFPDDWLNKMYSYNECKSENQYYNVTCKIQTHKTLITFSLYIKLRTTTTLEGCMNTVTFCKSTFLLTFYVSRVCAIKLLSGMQKWYNFISFCDTRYLSRSRLLLTPITSALWSRNTERFSLTYYLWGVALFGSVFYYVCVL